MTDKNPPPAYDPNFSMTDSTPASWTHVNQPLPGQVEVVNVDVNQVEVVQVEAVQVVFNRLPSLRSISKLCDKYEFFSLQALKFEVF